MSDNLKKVITPNLNEEKIDKLIKLSNYKDNDSIHAKLDLIMHNQLIIGRELKKLLQPTKEDI